MEEMKCFCINGSKKLIFRQEDNIYICFDPSALEFYEINEVGACILFLISENQNYEHIITILQDWFDMDKDEVEQFVNEFIAVFPMKKLILTNLIELGVPSICLYV